MVKWACTHNFSAKMCVRIVMAGCSVVVALLLVLGGGGERSTSESRPMHWFSCEGTVVPVHAMNSCGVTGSLSPLILNFGTRCRQFASLTARLLHLTKKRPPPIPIDRGLCGPQSQCGRYVEEENLLLPGFEPLFLDCPTRTVFTIPAELSWLRCIGRNVKKKRFSTVAKYNTEVQQSGCDACGVQFVNSTLLAFRLA
jgi:hypothetical protein